MCLISGISIWPFTSTITSRISRREIICNDFSVSVVQSPSRGVVVGFGEFPKHLSLEPTLDRPKSFVSSLVTAVFRRGCAGIGIQILAASSTLIFLIYLTTYGH